MELIAVLLLIATGAPLLGGAAVLWVKTRRGAALLQLIAASVIFLACATFGLAVLLGTLGHNTMFDTLRTSRADIVIYVALALAIVVFSFTYLFYALGHKRI